METPLIVYNLGDRGRKHRGKERNFNLRKLAAAINSDETQERVKNRDMPGFYGHLFRARFGLNPPETVIVGGNVVRLDPAFVTTHLRALPDGTIEHKAEFLNTDAGQLAQKAYASKFGGFSSAIDQIKPEFCGFDYVFEPNFNNNRGYSVALDSVSVAERDAVFDSIIVAEYKDQMTGCLRLLDSVSKAHELALQSVDHLRQENEELMSMLAVGRDEAALDSVPILPLSVSRAPAQRIISDIASFRNARLPRFVEPKGDESGQMERAYDRLLNRFGIGG
ncbi:hypothetical protein F6R98_10455 [Candidatus Methylospira mobilis]|uniref:Uncharacterized protein n=1 Tax=Candidatus Methylospira mobilis TaxID=1808979 RepID=A0A5Q0BGN2_9GAMM|nr:hypothetical protein [Candidatus Methylospira mobilis]QFY42983.1 hypothetical protein F6R98_10455 [Candidatus Methylospira mobilis]